MNSVCSDEQYLLGWTVFFSDEQSCPTSLKIALSDQFEDRSDQLECANQKFSDLYISLKNDPNALKICRSTRNHALNNFVEANFVWKPLFHTLLNHKPRLFRKIRKSQKFHKSSPILIQTLKLIDSIQSLIKNEVIWTQIINQFDQEHQNRSNIDFFKNFQKILKNCSNLPQIDFDSSSDTNC